MTIQRIKQAAAGVIVLGLLAAVPVQAQEQWFAVSWGAAAPFSDTEAFAEGTSFRNIAFEYSYFTRRDLAIGFSAGWSVFDNRYDDITSSFDGTDLTGTQLRYVNAFPFLVTGRYFLTGRQSGNTVDFFVGAGVGTMIAENRVDVGTFTVTDTNWHLAIAPEAGVTYGFNRYFAGYAQARYNYAFEASDIGHRFLNINVGLAWRK